VPKKVKSAAAAAADPALLAENGRMRREPVQARSRETVERILDAAEAVIDEAGVNAATTRVIAERAGVAAPSLYRFFENREQILDRILQRHMVSLDAYIAAAEDGWQPRSLRELVDVELDLHVDYFEQHPSAIRLWFQGRVSPVVVAEVRERDRILGVRLHDVAVAAGLAPADRPLPFVVAVELGDRIVDLALRDGLVADRAVIEEGRVVLTSYLEQTLA
jgi:AcrR family transcriptional regulator